MFTGPRSFERISDCSYDSGASSDWFSPSKMARRIGEISIMTIYLRSNPS